MLAVIDMARAGGFSRVTLTTDRYVPFNAPFYASLGFIEQNSSNAAVSADEAGLWIETGMDP